MRDIRVATVQFQHAPGDRAYNLERIRHFTAEAARARAEIVAFPEMCVAGYWHLRTLPRPELEALAEPVPDGASSRELRDLSRALGVTLGAGLVECDEQGRLYNSYVVALPGGAWHCHRKLHCFISEHMESGDHYTVFDTPWDCRVGVLTCYDNNLVENSRATALLGAEVLLAPHQTGGCKSGSPEAMGRIDVALWENRDRDPEALAAEFRGPKGREWLMRWLPARAHDNGLFLVFSNGVGRDDDEVRTGNAMILDPYGRILVESQQIGDDMVIADLLASLRERSTGVRWMRARRPDLYKILVQTLGSEISAREARFS